VIEKLNIDLGKVITLYAKDSGGQLRVWSICSVDDVIVIEYGIDGGEMIEKEEVIDYGKAGRDIEEQIILRMKSRIKRKLDMGYVPDRNHAINNKRTNVLGLPRPMLAQPHTSVGIPETNLFIQFKYDGHRCLTAVRDNEIILYSRNGLIIDSVEHIISELQGLNFPTDIVLDGELYCHGVPLQRISSWVKRKQPDTLKLSYIIYDMIVPGSYADRYAYLNMVPWEDMEHLELATTVFVPKELHANFDFVENLDMSIRCGYEGLIVRPSDGKYEDGKRSKKLIKVKKFLDDEFEVIAITPSDDNVTVLTCKMKNGKTFKATAPGDQDQKRYALLHKHDFIGRTVTVKYANLTADGIPFHPVALGWRDKESE
jgi:DNA ligase-1